MATGGRGGDGDARAESSNGISRLDGVRVLVVESQPQVLDLVAEALGQCGARVTAVGSAAEGLAVLTADLPTLAETVAFLSQNQAETAQLRPANHPSPGVRS